MMYLLFGFGSGSDTGRKPGERLADDTAHFALRERQHSFAEALCKPRMRSLRVFRGEASVYPNNGY
jgi:hypothetical protein